MIESKLNLFLIKKFEIAGFFNIKKIKKKYTSYIKINILIQQLFRTLNILFKDKKKIFKLKKIIYIAILLLFHNLYI